MRTPSKLDPQKTATLELSLQRKIMTNRIKNHPRICLTLLCLSVFFSFLSSAGNATAETHSLTSPEAQIAPTEATPAKVIDEENRTMPTEDTSDTALVDSVELLKNEILKLNRDLFIPEEDLLFPASTQTAIFLSIDGSGLFQLDNAKIAIDKTPVGHHLYTEKEIAALNRGAVQRLYTGNISNGSHELVIVLSGIGPKGRDYKRAAKLEFEKSTAAQYIELKVEANPNNLQPNFNFKVWQ